MNSDTKAKRQLFILCGTQHGHVGNVPHIHAAIIMFATLATASPLVRSVNKENLSIIRRRPLRQASQNASSLSEGSRTQALADAAG